MKRNYLYPIFLLAGFSLYFLFLLTDTGSAAAQTFYPQDTTMPVVVDFINGDFEEPVLHEAIPPGSFHGEFGWTVTLEQYFSGSTSWLYVPDSEIPGWSAVEIKDEDAGSLYKNFIEMKSSVVVGDGGSQHGVQHVDIYGSIPQELYQVVETAPGTNIYYSFWLKRSYEFEFYCGQEGNASLIRKEIPGTSWQNYSGQVTADSNRTYFGYRGVSASTAAGPLLDNILFQTQSKLLINKEVITREAKGALLSEIITYKVAITNYGQTDTSNTVLTDVFGDEVEFYGNVTINGEAADHLAEFDSLTDTLTVRVGEGAANSSGGSIKGSVSEGAEQGETVVVTFDVKVVGNEGDIIKNQAAVSYDDKDFENYTNGGYRDYSNVTEIKVINGKRFPLEITKEVTEKTSVDETFWFYIEQYTPDGNTRIKSFYTSVEVAAGTIQGSRLLENLYAGYYQITEVDSNWKYEITDASLQTERIFAGDLYTPAAVNFVNEKVSDGWVHGSSGVINQMNGM